MNIERMSHKKARPEADYKGCRLGNDGIRGDGEWIKETDPTSGRGNEWVGFQVGKRGTGSGAIGYFGYSSPGKGSTGVLYSISPFRVSGLLLLPSHVAIVVLKLNGDSNAISRDRNAYTLFA
jgi:hypothetical protein